MTVVAIIQARMGSTRFPGKVLAEINNQPLLEILIARVKRSKLIDKIVVATTTEVDDDGLCDWLSINGVEYFRGSERDVLDRFWHCAKLFKADLVVRITADDPLKDPDIIDEIVGLLQSSDSIDYVSNTLKPSFPEGLDIEAFRFRALDKANAEALLDSEREHVTPFIWKNSKKFNLHNVEMSPDLSAWRWTVDKPEDLDFIKSLLHLAGDDIFLDYRALIKIVKRNFFLININSNTARNEGYISSVSAEKING
ncbi:glycosyltransferase family protein [Alphaproteobacteria bacterium]|nr:glycosyltransferase family protein [Alphaproteobacteria bacterium]